MMNFSKDPREAEKQIQAIIYYLVTFGYIDGDFDLQEKEFIRDYISKIVDHKLSQSEGLSELSEAATKQFKAEQEEHYNLVFEANDESIRELFSEVVDSQETVQKFIRHRLKLRCYEIFRSFKEDNRAALMDVIDEFIMADGVEHPAEVEFRNELADLLHLEPMLDMGDLEIIPSSLEITDEVARKIAQTNHPFMRNLEVHYSGDPAERLTQADGEMKTVIGTMALLDELRVKGAGKLRGKQSFDELMGEDDWFLDGHVFVIPPKAGREYDITVLGDLHGCYSCLKGALLQADFFNKVEAFRENPDSAPEPLVILLGDYIDRGKFSYNGILRAVMELFLKYPGHIFPLRGNHEYYIEYEGKIYGGVLPAEAINVHREYLPKEFFLTYMKFFEQLPTVAVFDRLFFVHAGIPKDELIENFTDLDSLNDPEVRFQMLWSDPSEADLIPKSLQEESARFPFGTMQFANFMATVGCNVMVRGHTKVVEGFKTVVDDGSHKLLNLFSAGGQYNDDLPSNSSYRGVTPKALTITYKDGDVTATPWVIDYESYNSPVYNRFFSVAPSIDYEESS
ncbi:MAG: metallophosphoesterase [bacterium]